MIAPILITGARPTRGRMQTNSSNTVKIVGIGDSTTAGTPGFLSPVEAPPRGAGDQRSQYAYWMVKSHSEWTVLNKGVNGERSDQILGRFESDVVAEEPRFVIILAGVNDVYQGFLPEFTRTNLELMYKMALRVKVTPVACSILPYNTMGPGEAITMRELNEWISAESKSLSIPFSDTGKAVASPGSPDKLAGSPDGLHPDVAGYRKMAEVISEAIEGWLVSNP